MQSPITSARIIIENPMIKNNDYKIQLQTLEKLLEMYEQILSTEGDSARSDEIDKIIMVRDTGNLKQYVKDIVNKQKW